MKRDCTTLIFSLLTFGPLLACGSGGSQSSGGMGGEGGVVTPGSGGSTSTAGGGGVGGDGGSPTTTGSGGGTVPDPDCQMQLDAAIHSDPPGEGLFVGAFQEEMSSEDPTGGLIIAVMPLGDGPIHGQMVNTYLDCLGNIGTGGTYDGTRVGDSLSGTWSMTQINGVFGGSWSGTATSQNAAIAGPYDVASGPANGDCASTFGVPSCYCASPGTFDLRHVADGNGQSAENIPFTVSPGSGGGVVFDTQDNPNTSGDESGDGQSYAILALDKTCTDEMPVVGYCPNFNANDPIEVAYSSACEIAFPLSTADQAKLFTCPCVFLDAMVSGAWYVGVGIHDPPGNGGISFGDIDVMSTKLFQY